MQKATLRIFFLLAALRGAPARNGGETCRRWLEGTAVPAAAFLCPEERDEADARFCCGPCHGTYCCASIAARLDQRECFRGARAVVPSGGLDGAPSAPEPEVVYIVVPLVAVITLAFGCFALVQYDTIQRCARACQGQQEPPPAAVCPMISPEDPLQPPALGLSPSFCPCETPVPLYSVEDPLRNWDLPPPYPGEPVVEFRHASPGVPGDGAVALFPLGGPSGQGCVWELAREPAE